MQEHKNTTWNFFIILYTKSVSLSPSLLQSLSLSATALIPIFINEENIFMNFDKQLQVCSFNWSSLKEYWIFLLVVDIIFLFSVLLVVLKTVRLQENLHHFVDYILKCIFEMVQ